MLQCRRCKIYVIDFYKINGVLAIAASSPTPCLWKSRLGRCRRRVYHKRAYTRARRQILLYRLLLLEMLYIRTNTINSHTCLSSSKLVSWGREHLCFNITFLLFNIIRQGSQFSDYILVQKINMKANFLFCKKYSCGINTFFTPLCSCWIVFFTKLYH